MTTARTRELRRSAGWNPDVWTQQATFWPLRESAAPFHDAREFPTVEAINAALSPLAGIHFRTQAAVPRRQRGTQRIAARGYDACIVEDGYVPTREGSWHDLMNALVWAAFPKTKRLVHHLQHAFVEEERRQGRAGMRLPAHDALAILDEGGVCIVSATAIEETTASVDSALAMGRARAVVFGHAIYETLALGGPWPLVRGVVLQVDPRAAALSTPVANMVRAVDEALSAQLEPGTFPTTPKDLVCLPPPHLAPYLGTDHKSS